jgi:hypothetical protein
LIKQEKIGKVRKLRFTRSDDKMNTIFQEKPTLRTDNPENHLRDYVKSHEELINKIQKEHKIKNKS